MSDKAIEVIETAGGYEVRVHEGASETRHSVTLKPADLARFGGGRDGPALVRAAFRFLLENEPKEAILSRFDLSAISRFFPEFERELPRHFDPS